MDPQAPPSEARIVWLPANDTSAVFLGPVPAGLVADTDPKPTFDAAYRIADDDEDVLLCDLGDGQRIQLVIETATPVGQPLAAIIPLGRDGFDRVQSLCRLLATLHNRAIPPDTRLTVQQRRRLRRMLQCFDGYRAGATQREIAQVVFHIAQLDRQAWQDASARHAIKTLLRDARAMIAGGYPFFSLSKSHRTAPIDFYAAGVSIRVEAVPDHGMATIWDADILIWAASQIVEARDAGLRTSRLMVATPYEILKFIGRGTSLRDYQRLKAALDRLQSTTICTSIRQPAEGRRHRFSWINEWKERTDRNGKPDGIELIVPDWFYQAVLDDALVLTIDRAYFGLAGGLDRWLYRIVRKHGGRQRKGWRFDFRHLHQKSGALSPFKRFAFELRDIIRRQPLPGYTLFLEIEAGGRTLLAFEPRPVCGKAVDGFVPSGTQGRVPSGTALSCQREPKLALTRGTQSENLSLNLESNEESNLEERASEVENLVRQATNALSVTGKRRTKAGDTHPLPQRPFGSRPGGRR